MKATQPVPKGFHTITPHLTEVVMPVEDMFWGDRYGIVQDPFGHRWSIASCREELTPEEVMERAAKAFSAGDCGEA